MKSLLFLYDYIKIISFKWPLKSIGYKRLIFFNLYLGLKNIFNRKKIRILKKRNAKKKFYGKNQIFNEKEITKFSEIPLKIKACNIDSYEPAYIKVKGRKYYLSENDNWD